jgi:hypothetical protein
VGGGGSNHRVTWKVYCQAHSSPKTPICPNNFSIVQSLLRFVLLIKKGRWVFATIVRRKRSNDRGDPCAHHFRTDFPCLPEVLSSRWLCGILWKRQDALGGSASSMQSKKNVDANILR